MHKYCAAVRMCVSVCVCVRMCASFGVFTGGIILCLPWLIMQLIMWLRSQKCEDYAAVRRRAPPYTSKSYNVLSERGGLMEGGAGLTEGETNIRISGTYVPSELF